MVANSPYGIAYFSYNSSQASLSSQMITDMQNAGITRLRVQMPWAFIDPNANGAYLWTALDDMVSQVNNAGLYITFVFEKQPIGYASSNAGPYSGTISSGGGIGSTSITLTAAATHLYADFSYIIVSGGGNPSEIVAIGTSYSAQSATIPLQSGLRFGGRTTVQWYGYPDGNVVATFATALATRYNGLNGHGYIDQYEMGNEEFDSGRTDQSDSNTTMDYMVVYGNYATAVHDAIKVASPNAVVGTCAILWSQAPHTHNKITNIYANGNSSKWDYCNFHFYPYETGSNGQIDPVRPCYGPQNASVIPTFPQCITDMSSVMASNSDSAKKIFCTEIGWYTYDYPDTRNTNSAVASKDVQARCYFMTLDIARKSGAAGGFSFWTMDYAYVNDALHSTDGSSANRYSDGMSLVQIRYSGNALQYNFYMPAFYQLKAYIARWSDWNATAGSNAHTFLAFDGFINVPNHQTTANVNPNQRVNVALSTTGNFGTPSCTSFAASTTSPNTATTDWIHYGSGVPTIGFQNDEGQLASSSSGIVDYFRLGSVTSVNQELVLRISTANSNDRIGLCARLSGSGSSNTSINCYQLYVVGGTLTIAKTVNGSSNTLASTTVTQASGKFYWMRFSVTGTTNTSISAYFWACDCGDVNNASSANSATVEPSTPTLSVVDSVSPITAASGFGFAGLATTSSPISFDTFMATQPVTAATQIYKAVPGRLRLSASTLKDITTRLYLNFIRSNLAARLNLQQITTATARFLSARLRLKQQAVNYVTDIFGIRSNTGTFGAASDGVNTWTTAYSDTYSNISVGSNEGRVCSNQGGTTTYTRFTIGTNVGDDTVKASLKIENAGDILGVLVHFQNNSNYYQLQLGSNGATFGKTVAGITTFFNPVVSNFSPVLNTTYTLKCKSVGGNTYYCKVWVSSISEPTSWNAVFTDTTFPSGLQGLYFYASGAVPNYAVASYFNSAVQPDAILDTSARMRLSAPIQKFLVNRVSIGVLSGKDFIGRLGISVSIAKFLVSRILISASVLRNLATRIRISISTQAFLSSRVRLLSNSLYFLSSRIKLLANTTRDMAGRARLQASTTKDATTRANLQGSANRNLATRVPMSSTKFSLFQSRLRLQGNIMNNLVNRVIVAASTTKNVVGRMRLMAGQARDWGTRALVANKTTKDTATRANVGQLLSRNIVGRLRLMAGQARDWETRTQVSANTTKNAATRANVGQPVFRFLSSRANVAIAQIQAWSNRVHLSQSTQRDLATRLKLSIPGAILDFFATRITLIDNATKNLRSRVNMAILVSKNAVLRTGIKDLSMKSMSTRFPLSASLIRTLNSRVKISASTLRDVALRAKVSANTFMTLSGRALINASRTQSLNVRTRISASTLRDVATRAALQDQRSLSVPMRSKIAQTQQRFYELRVIIRSLITPRDFVTRISLQDDAFKAWKSRTKIAAFKTGDAGSRAHMAILQIQMMSVRILVSASQNINYQARVRLFDVSNRYLQARAGLCAKASGNILQVLRLSDTTFQRSLGNRVLLRTTTGFDVGSRVNLRPTKGSLNDTRMRFNFVAYPVIALNAISPGEAPSAKILLWYVGETYPLWNIAIFSNAVTLDLSAMDNDSFSLRFSNPQTATDYAGQGGIAIIRRNPGVIEYHVKASDVMAESTFDVYLGVSYPSGDFEEFFVTTMRVVPLHTRNLP